MEGYIKLHKQLVGWEWYTDIPVKVLFIHLLLRANHKDTEWKGQRLEMGQLITSITHLSKETGLTISQVRTALDKLRSTNEISTVVTRKWTLITVENYGVYQLNEKNVANKSHSSRTKHHKQIAQNIANKSHAESLANTDVERFDKSDIAQTIADKSHETSQQRKNNINNINTNTLYIYGEFQNVHLSDEEFQKLKEKFPNDYADRIERLSTYIASSGKKYKSHYATILSWSRKEVKKNELPQRAGKGSGDETDAYVAAMFR